MYQVYKDINKQINACLDLDVDGIELLIPYAIKLIKFNLKKSQIKKFKKFKYNTVHFPFYNKKERQQLFLYNTKYCRKLVEKIYKLAKQINAVNINIHAHQLKNPKVLDGLTDMNYTLENLTEDHNFKISDYKKAFKKNQNFNMLLDTSHGIRTNQLKDLVKTFKNKISLIHLSAAKGPKDDHYLLHRFNNKNKKQLEIVKKLACPIIIEAGREKGLTLDDYKKEIRYVKNWLNKK